MTPGVSATMRFVCPSPLSLAPCGPSCALRVWATTFAPSSAPRLPILPMPPVTGGGNFRPRLFARLRIPVAALFFKKNLSGTWSSKTSDNVHSTAALGDSEMLAVKHTPRYPIPALDHENPLDLRKVSSVGCY